MAVTKEKAIAVHSRTTGGETETTNYKYISMAVSSSSIKSACQSLYSLSNNTYIDATVSESYSLNEAAAEEE